MITFNCVKEMIGQQGLVVMGEDVDNFFTDSDILAVGLDDDSSKTMQISSFLIEVIQVLETLKQKDSIKLNGLSYIFQQSGFNPCMIESTLVRIKELSEKYRVIICISLFTELETNIVKSIDEKNPGIIDVLCRKQSSFDMPDFMIADDGYYPNDGWSWYLR